MPRLTPSAAALELGRALRTRREALPATRPRAAEALGYSADRVRQVETGRYPPGVDYMARWVAVYGELDQELRGLWDRVLAEGSRANGPELVVLPGDPAETMELAARLRSSDVDTATIETLTMTCERLCAEYAARSALELRREAQGWLHYVGRLLGKRTRLDQHRDLLVIAGWLMLLIGCLEYDSGMPSAAETTRLGAVHLGQEADHTEIMAWAHEMAAWIAHTRHDLVATVAAARAGQEFARGASVAVQLIAHEARALARMGDEREVHAALERGHRVLGRLPKASNARNHFVVDPDKFDFYAMDVYLVGGDNTRAAGHAREVLRAGQGPDGKDRAPMRVSEARIALATVAIRQGDLEKADHDATTAFRADRKCLPSLLLVADQLGREMRQRYPDEQQTREFDERLTVLRRAANL